jgi:hypothetical protein
MKKILLKTVVAVASLVTVIGYAGTASAHDYAGTLAAGTVANGYWGGQTDVWEVSCPAGEGADHLGISITNIKPAAAPVVSFAAYKAGQPFVVKGESDPKDNDGIYSKEVNIAGGSGSYFIFVKKTEGVRTALQTEKVQLTKVAAQNYSLSVHCGTATNQHTNLDTQTGDLRQNQ